MIQLPSGFHGFWLEINCLSYWKVFVYVEWLLFRLSEFCLCSWLLIHWVWCAYVWISLSLFYFEPVELLGCTSAFIKFESSSAIISSHILFLPLSFFHSFWLSYYVFLMVPHSSLRLHSSFFIPYSLWFSDEIISNRPNIKLADFFFIQFILQRNLSSEFFVLLIIFISLEFLVGLQVIFNCSYSLYSEMLTYFISLGMISISSLNICMIAYLCLHLVCPMSGHPQEFLLASFSPCVMAKLFCFFIYLVIFVENWAF